MRDLIYDPKLINEYSTELGRIYYKYRSIADSFRNTSARCPHEIISASSVSSARHTAVDKMDNLALNMNQMIHILEQIYSVYMQADKDLMEQGELLKSDVEEIYTDVMSAVAGAYYYSEDVIPYSMDKSTTTFNTDLDVPQWLMDELVKQYNG